MRSKHVENTSTYRPKHMCLQGCVHVSVREMSLCKQINRWRTKCAALLENLTNSLFKLSSPCFPKHTRLSKLLSFSFHQHHIIHTPLGRSAPSLRLFIPPHKLLGYCVTLDMGRACRSSVASAVLSQHLNRSWLFHRVSPIDQVNR